MEIVFHFGTSFAQYSIESTTRRIEGAGGKMNSFWAMNSLRMSFCSVPPSLLAGTPCFSATAMYMHRRIAAGGLVVIGVPLPAHCNPRTTDPQSPTHTPPDPPNP